MATPKSVLRGLLKAVNKHVTSVAGNTQWRDFIVAKVRADARAADPSLTKERLELAGDLKFFITNISYHKGLLASYNIGTNPDDRNKQMVEAVAKRVGFRMPNEAVLPRKAAAVKSSQEEAA